MINIDLVGRIDKNVHMIIELIYQSRNARTDSGKKLKQAMAAKLDHEIDQLVYELYELTPEEIAIVEEATK